MPIGEMWDLEKLSEKCKSTKRYSKSCVSITVSTLQDTNLIITAFFVTSAPLHVKGGIGSPPGAIAIF